MRKLARIAAASAVLALIVVVGSGLLGGQGAFAQDMVYFDIDPETTGNTASTLGTVEQNCYEITCDAGNTPPDCTWDGSATFDGVSDYIIDVVVTGDTQAPIGYDAALNYCDDPSVAGDPNACDVGDPVTKVHVAAPDTDDVIKLPGGFPLSDTLPDSDGLFGAGVIYLSGGPGTAGDGTIFRVGLDIGASGVVPFSLNPSPATAYASLLTPAPDPPHPVTVDGVKLAINTTCPLPEVDLSVDPADGGGSVVTLGGETYTSSSTPDPVAQLDASTNYTLHVDTTGVHTGGPLTDTVAATISHTVTAPADCTVNGGASASDSWSGSLASGASHTLSTDFTLHCSQPSDHTFEVVNTIELLEAGYEDPDDTNDTDTVSVPVEVWGPADVKITDQLLVDPPGQIPFDTDVEVTLRKTLHNNGPYGPVNVDVTTNVPAVANCTANLTSQTPSNPVGLPLPLSTDVQVDEVWTIHCTELGSKSFTFQDSAYLVGVSHVEDRDETNNDQDTVWDTEVLPSADLNKVSFAPGKFNLDADPDYETDYVPGLEIPVSQQIWFQVNETVHNDGPTDDVAARVIVTCTPPESLAGGTAGGACSYHVQSGGPTEMLTLDGAYLDCDPTHLPTGVVECNPGCGSYVAMGSGECPADTVVTVEWDGTAHVLDVHKTTGPLEISVNQVLTQEWDVHCYEPSTHVWQFTNDIEPVDAGVVDPNDTNNHREFDLTLDCIAEADVQILTQAFDSPPAEIYPGEDTVVTLRKTLHNIGPYGPVDVSIDTQRTLPTAPPNCTAVADPGNPGSANLPLPVSTNVVVDEDWTINCDADATAVTFIFDNTIAITTEHVEDPDPDVGPNSASTPLEVDVVSELGDVDCDTAWTVLDALYVLQYAALLRAEANQCPLPDPQNQLYLPAANVNGDAFVDVIDALFILQCAAELWGNPLCPGDG